MEQYLKYKGIASVFIGHPFSYAVDKPSFYRIYEDGKLKAERKAKAWKLPGLFMYLKDFIYTIIWMVKLREGSDIYVGADPLNAFAGILLKKIRKVNIVILYSIDYVPKRFNNRIMNSLYHWLDSYCVKHSDMVWNLSHRMAEGRERKGIPNDDKQIVVPEGVHFNRIKRLPIDKINRKHIVFLGHLRKAQGLELLIEALPEVVKSIPDVKLVIVGTGPLENKFKYMTEKLGLEKHIEFRGSIEDDRDVEETLTQCAIGLAPYEPDPNSVTWYADPHKPKQYMACGLPVITTRVAWIAKEIEKGSMGIVINYDKEELTEAITKLAMDHEFYKICRENAIEFASHLDWDEIFKKAFSKISLLRCG